MAKPIDREELDGFLSQVDKIESLIKSMNAEDCTERQRAFEEADKMLESCDNTQHKSVNSKDEKQHGQCTIGVDRTVINKDSSVNDNKCDPDYGSDQAAFMQVLASDAEERAQRRKKRKRESDNLKEKGNQSFKDGDYIQAVNYYTLASNELKDNLPIWTNRAQAYIKLGDYEKAIADCDFAFKIDETCLKAFIHKGRALMHLEQFRDARKVFNDALELNPTESKVIQKYLDDLNTLQAKLKREKKAMAACKDGNEAAKSVQDVIKNLQQSGQHILFYSGGLCLLAQLMKDETQRTLFRTSGGFRLIAENVLIQGCLTGDVDSSDDKLSLCSAVLSALSEACLHCVDNQQELFQCPLICNSILHLLCKVYDENIRNQAAILLNTISDESVGRQLICAHIDLRELVLGLQILSSEIERVALLALQILKCMCTEHRFRDYFATSAQEALLPCLEKILVHPREESYLPLCLTALGSLCSSPSIRACMSGRRDLWIACLVVLRKYSPLLSEREDSVDALYMLLGLLSNLSVNTTKSASETIQLLASEVYTDLRPLLSYSRIDVQERAAAVLAHLASISTQVQDLICNDDSEPSAIGQLAQHARSDLSPELVKHSAKILALCTADSENARTKFMAQEKSLQTVGKLLHSTDEAVLANGSLLLSHLILVPGVPQKLTKTNVCKELLKLAGDHSNETVRANSAIALGKLASSDSRHLDKIRSLHGMSILHSCMKYIK